MREAGAPEEVIEQVIAKDTGCPQIQPANLITIRLFFACATQWIYAGMAGTRTGLNYQAVEVRASKMTEFLELDLEDQNWIWEGLTQMESTALKVWQSKD